MKSAFEKTVLASGNPGKCREFESLLAPLGIEVVSQKSLGITPAPEPYGTFLENALTKARHASAQSGLPALADDSGLCVSALDGAPGVQSARFAQPQQGMEQDALNNAKLVQVLSQVTNRHAYYVAVLVLVRHAEDPLPIVAQAIWPGEIVLEAQGTHGFGYDPHFWIAALQKTVAQLDPAVKNQISHRALASQRLIEILNTPSVAQPKSSATHSNAADAGCAVTL